MPGFRPMTFKVFGYDGQPIGSAEDFGTAKKMQEQDIREHAPAMLDSYEGVSTDRETFGHPVFALAA